MIGPNCVIISKEDLAGAPDEVRTWMSSFFFGGASSGKAASKPKKETAAQKKAREKKEAEANQSDAMKALLEAAGEMMKNAEGKAALKMALKVVGVPRASECPEDKIAELMALISGE